MSFSTQKPSALMLWVCHLKVSKVSIIVELSLGAFFFFFLQYLQIPWKITTAVCVAYECAAVTS